MGASFIIGAFFVHWLADHESLWRGALVSDSGMQNSLGEFRGPMLIMLKLALFQVVLRCMRKRALLEGIQDPPPAHVELTPSPSPSL